MPLSKRDTANVPRRDLTPLHIRFLRELLIWDTAWREFRQLQNLDADALADMELTETDRAAVTVYQIAERMRA